LEEIFLFQGGELVLKVKEVIMPIVYSGGKQTASRFLINNVVGTDVARLAQLANAALIEPSVMNERLNTELMAMLSELPKSAIPIVIYPGNGANQLSGKLSALKGVASLSVHAKRYWQPGESPVCVVEEFAFPDGVTHCLVVDDVISSGGTMQTVRKYVPNEVECWAVAEVSQRLSKVRHKTLCGFTRVIVGAELCNDAVSYVPINSVSTLRVDSELARVYAERNVSPENREAFLSLL
jgi:hypothetical protein